MHFGNPVNVDVRVKISSENIDRIKIGEPILFLPAKMTILIDNSEEHLAT